MPRPPGSQQPYNPCKPVRESTLPWPHSLDGTAAVSLEARTSGTRTDLAPLCARGTSVTRAALRRAGGEIRVESALGSGTTFIVDLAQAWRRLGAVYVPAEKSGAAAVDAASVSAFSARWSRAINR